MSYELHVLEGQQRGARAQVPGDRALSIGAELDSDIVLRGADVADRRACFTVHAEHWVVDVLQGELQADGKTIAAGQTATLPLGAALSIGASQVAVQRVAPAAPAPDEADDDAPPSGAPIGNQAVPISPPARNLNLQRWSRRLATAGGGVAAVCVGMLAFAYSIQPVPQNAAQRALQLQSQLHGAGLAGLSVRADEPSQTLLVQGQVASAAERAKGEALLQQSVLPVQWKAWVSDQAAEQVRDVFRTHGITAKVQTVAPGALRVATSVADPSALDAVRAAAQRDVPGLEKLEIANTLPPPDTRGTPINDPGKRVASIVPGDPPYVVTADGTRYFKGAMLPTGHRISAIDKQQVLLEINGVSTPLPF
jgi:type III secretion protein D